LMVMLKNYIKELAHTIIPILVFIWIVQETLV
jgi:hypothetical protein